MWAPCHQVPPSPALISSTILKAAMTPTNSATSSQEGKQRGEQWRGFGEENDWDQGGVQNPLRLCEAYTLPRHFTSFCGIDHETAWKIRTPCCSVCPPHGIQEEAVWSTHTALFLLFPAVSMARRHGNHMLLHLFFPWHLR